MPSVAETRIELSTFGSTWLRDDARARMPLAWAASTNSRRFTARTSPRTMRAVVHPARHADADDNQDEDAGRRPESRAQGLAKQGDDDQQKRQQRQREKQIGQAHQRTVEPRQ